MREYNFQRDLIDGKAMGGSKMDIQRLIEIGGSEWIKDGYHRIYFNLDIMTEMIGLDLSFYKTGRSLYT